MHPDIRAKELVLVRTENRYSAASASMNVDIPQYGVVGQRTI